MGFQDALDEERVVGLNCSAQSLRWINPGKQTEELTFADIGEYVTEH
jgi:hypothetical protein